MVKANTLLSNFLHSKKKTVFVDVYHKMLDENGNPMPDIFLDDNLHMNAKGLSHLAKSNRTLFAERIKNNYEIYFVFD